MKIRRILLILILALAAILRIWKLDSVPVSLFGDEVDVGYQAYSILTTGKDYMGNIALFYVNSIADKKAPLYSYLAAPAVAMFGISPLGVRLPAAIFGVLGVLLIFGVVKLLTNETIGLIAAILLAVSPWHIQFSRWGLEHTLMLSLFLAGVYFFLKGLSQNKWLLISSVCFSLTPYAYHAGKIFLPLILIVILILFWQEVKKISKGYLMASFLIIAIIAGSIIISSTLGKSAERFNSLSVWSDSRNTGEIGFDRVRDSQMFAPFGRLFHNKVTLLLGKIEENYFHAFSTEFLFVRGDTNLRHSILQNGEFYRYQLFFLIVGLIFLTVKIPNQKYKLFIISWLLLAPFPAMVTTEGGGHAARLFFMLVPLIIIIAIGIYYSYLVLGKKLKNVYLLGIVLLFSLSFIFYQHNYWIHYPWDSERWWQAGFKEVIQSTVKEGKKYEKVIISQADEPALLFFLGWSQYPPAEFQQKYPLVKESLEGIGEVSKLDKYYFPPIGYGIGLYELGSVLPPKTLYLATFKEINLDLIREPERVPQDIKLIKSITYPSGAPAFYLFEKVI